MPQAGETDSFFLGQGFPRKQECQPLLTYGCVSSSLFQLTNQPIRNLLSHYGPVKMRQPQIC
jgi:hypothetical protein